MHETTITKLWEQAVELASQLEYTISREDHEFVLTKSWETIESFETVEGVYGFLKGKTQ